MTTVLAWIAAVLVAMWGVAHAIPTRQVLEGFEPITEDNRRVILQEWLAEAVTMWGLAAIVITVTVVEGAEANASVAIYRVVAAVLVALAVLTSFTGARTPVIWFKICPVLLTTSALLLLAASWL